ncbi:MAG: hypothetical protein COB67_02675 [SAR324 cluster bacterium]|uniref:Uncharacterized protein n=1 Tax=SAR324 cluster bacterium TaxID=2024889 RepID=A0A2A4T8N3_9DELT|nr:MAG: hypothetical protein COB67_02675 [SAR324 cluster bacterium]
MKCIIYSDGSTNQKCSPVLGGWAYLIIGEKGAIAKFNSLKSWNLGEKEQYWSGEPIAIQEAANHAITIGYTDLTVITDSRNSINWIDRFKSGNTISENYRNIMQNLISKIDFKFCKVDSHKMRVLSASKTDHVLIEPNDVISLCNNIVLDGSNVKQNVLLNSVVDSLARIAVNNDELFEDFELSEDNCLSCSNKKLPILKAVNKQYAIYCLKKLLG